GPAAGDQRDPRSGRRDARRRARPGLHRQGASRQPARNPSLITAAPVPGYPVERQIPIPTRHSQVVLMKVGVAMETAAGERRVALVPEVLGKLTAAGLQVLVEAGAGTGAAIPDSAYAEAGAQI